MAVNTHHNQKKDLTIFTVVGQSSFEEQLHALEQFYSNNPTANEIWDFTQADPVTITSTEIQKLITYTKQWAHKRPAGKTAFIANTELKFGLSRMSAALMDNGDIPWIADVFENNQDALEWIAGTALPPQ